MEEAADESSTKKRKTAIKRYQFQFKDSTPALQAQLGGFKIFPHRPDPADWSDPLTGVA